MGELEQALQFYETANDYYSVVRILCFNGQIARAIEVAEESGCKASAYHLAKRLSMENGVGE
jgi:intraflagellar transport protein 140